MKKLIQHIFLVLALCGFIDLKAQEIRVNAVIDSNKIRIGEQTKLDLYVQYNATQKNLKIQWPSFADTITGKIDIVSKSPIDSTFPDKNNPSVVQQHQQFIITAFDSGYYAIPPFKFVVNDDTINPVLSEPLLLEVNTVPTDTSETKLKDIKAPFEEPFDWKWYLPHAYWTLGILAVLAIAIYLIYRFTKKKPIVVEPEKPKVPAHITALDALEKIKAEALWKEGKVKEYYSSISDAVRLYIEQRFNVNALELTTDEINRAFRSQVVDSLSKEKLSQLLVLSDFVKFAKQIPIEQEHNLTLQNAFDFVNGTKREEVVEIATTQETITDNSANAQ